MRILFVWELGASYGHMLVYRDVIDRLILEGHTVYFAAREPHRLESVFANRDVVYLPAPIRHGRPAQQVRAVLNYSHILFNIGFAEPDAVLSLCKSWLSLAGLVQPDIVVADHSPTALLAFRGSAFPVVVVGSGFLVPPDTDPLPMLRGDVQLPDGSMAGFEERLLSALNKVLDRIKGPFLTRIGQLYSDAAESILTTYRELDHYPDRSGGNYYGISPSPKAEVPRWPPGGRRRVFGYLMNSRELPVLLSLLNQLELPTLIVPNDIPLSVQQKHTSATLCFAESPVDLAVAAADSHLGITNGNQSTTSSFLLAGRPLLLLPVSLEQDLGSRAAARTGAAYYVPPEYPRAIFAGLAELLNEGKYTEAAKAFAARHPIAEVAAMPERLANRIVELAGGSAASPAS